MASVKPVSLKKENMKHAHGEVQDQFAKLLAVALENPHGAELQCCVTYSKPCGCIRKFILGGEKWKENPDLQLRNSVEIDCLSVAEADKRMLGHPQMERARELIGVYEYAAELKKEKCYAFNNVGEVEGKSLKELRGMIGLGNGRKRSKKYEDYVLQTRSKLRTEYTLCEKAAQKLLGYSINFLYKKLRTNPQKTSRLVATNKAERASKAPRNLIPLDELREMGRNSNSANQCCGRNCISRLASQNFDKIEDWRRRLDGSGQRVAQEIVAEVLRASTSSLDGQSSFCQNLVHWVTGCSFKKIRRVRDHLKKDPQSLPEHGLKKYWKDKVKGRQKSEPAQKIPKIEQMDFPESSMMHMQSSMGYGGGNAVPGVQMQQSSFIQPYNNVADGMYMPVVNNSTQRLGNFSSVAGESNSSDQWPGINVNNSNNMLMPPGAYGVSSRENKPNVGSLPGAAVPHSYTQQLQQEENRRTPNATQVASNSGHYPQNHGQSVTYASQDSIGQFRMQQRQMTTSPYQAMSVAATDHPQYGQQYMGALSMENQVEQNRGHAPRGSVILHTAGSHHQQLAASQKEPPPYSQPAAIPTHGNHISEAESYGVRQIDPNQNQMVGMAVDPNQMYSQHYYIAAANNGQGNGSLFQGGRPQGLTPFILSGGDGENLDDNKNGDLYRQPFYILSPIPPPGDKGFSANDLKNFQQLPLTPIQILPTPYLPSGKNFESNADGRQEQQQFFFPMPFSNPETVPSDDVENSQGGKDFNENAAMNFRNGAALTSLAVVHSGSGLFNLGSWQMPNQSGVADGGNMQVQHDGNGNGQQWPILALQQYPPNVTLQQGQNQGMYGTPQLQSFQMQNAGDVSQQQGTNWGRESEKKPALELGENDQPHVQAINVDTESLHQKTLEYEHTMRGQLDKGNVVTQEKDSLEDKDGGIVTPKIIRDALYSGNFNAGASIPVLSGRQSAPVAAALAPVGKGVEGVAAPMLEMPKLSPAPSQSDKQSEGDPSAGGEEGCAAISSRMKRFSRDRLRATIDSPNIVLTPFTPLTPNITPVTVIPDTSGDETGKETSASSTGSQQKDGSVFLFPPTHVSRRRAAIRLQGQTVSKGKVPKDSPKTPGPFPVAAEGTSTAVKGSEKAEAVEPVSDNEEVKSSAGEKAKSPALTLKDPTTQTSEGDKLPKEKMPVIGFEASNWHADPDMSSLGTEASDDNALNTPTQQSLNTPTCLNTPNQQLDTPNHDLKTPTESPVKSQHAALSKRKREGSPVPLSAASVSDESLSSTDSKTNPSAAKSLRFHCFTPKDFDESASCSAFRKPSEFASAPADSVIAQRRKKPRKHSHPLSVTSAEDEKAGGVTTADGDSSDTRESDDSVIEINNKKEEPSDSASHAKGNKSLFSSKPSLSGFARGPDGNVMILGNAYDSQTPSFLQLITPSLFSSNTGLQDTPRRQQTPFSSQQVNTPVFLHSATFLTPGGSGVLRRISPGLPQQVGGANCGISGAPQVFTFMPNGLQTPKKLGNSQEACKDQSSEQRSDGAEDTTEKKENGKNVSSSVKGEQGNFKHAPMIIPINMSDIPASPALPHKDSGLQTPSNLKVVTPSLAFNNAGAVSSSEPSQVFTFPSSGHPSLQRSAPRGGLVLCAPSKASASGPIVYHPLASPSSATGPVALVPIEMLQPTKQTHVAKKDSPNADVQSTSKTLGATSKADNRSDDEVAEVMVDSPVDDGKGSKAAESDKSNKDSDSRNDSTEATSATEIVPLTVATSSAPEKTSSAAKLPVTTRPKTLSSPKAAFLKPLIVAPMGVENPNVQTPTMLQLISPSQHSPNSPLVLYPMIRPPHGQCGIKLQSPLSASGTTGTPPLMILQRVMGPGGSSSLLKSALMKSMPVFQFPPSSAPSSSSPTSAPSATIDSPSTSKGQETITSPSSPPTSSSVDPSGSRSSDDEVPAPATSSAAVSVICGPRLSNQQPMEKNSSEPKAEIPKE